MSDWVVDTGPLIFLAKLGRLNLLRDAVDQVLIPSAVLAEVQGHTDDAARQIIAATETWLQVRPVEYQTAIDLLLADLDLGESEVIALAVEVRAERVVMDDMQARRFARRSGIDVVGTVGLLLAARLRGEVNSLRDEIDRLQHLGFWISEALVETVLREAGEDPISDR